MNRYRTRDPRREPAPHADETCANQGCRRPAAAGEALCDTCQLERALFRRDERPCLSESARTAQR